MITKQNRLAVLKASARIIKAADKKLKGIIKNIKQKYPSLCKDWGAYYQPERRRN